jgi:AAA15 family ATPase/GTPase
VIDLRFGEGKAPNGYRQMMLHPFLETIGTKERFTPIQALYGANASGKTNVIRAIQVLQNIVLAHDGIKGKFQPNKITGNLSATCFCLTFFAKTRKFQYTVEYDKEHIIHESLVALDEKPTNVFEIQDGIVETSYIVTELYTEKKLQEILRVECTGDKGLQQITFLSKLATNYQGLNDKIAEAYDFFDNSLYVFTRNSFLLSEGIDVLTCQDNKTEIDVAIERITKLIQKLDIGIKQITVERTTCSEEEFKALLPSKTSVYMRRQDKNICFDSIQTKHIDNDGQEIWFDYKEESAGTQVLAGLLCILLKILDDGAVIFIDELDNSLHSFVFREVVKLFKDKRYNKNNAQLIFTAHNTDLLEDDDVRVSEIGIVSKTASTGTTVTRLSDFEGIRNVLDFRRQYLSGTFSGIPFPYI